MAKKTISKLLCCSALCSLLAFNANAAEIATNTAQMQAMDKITGKVSLIEVPVNGAVKFGSFSILVRSCKTRSPEETPENFAFVDVVDDYDNKPANIFRGWMISSSPALNAVEHPIYDVWLLKCIDTKVDAKKLLTAEQLKERDDLETVSVSEKVVELNPNLEKDAIQSVENTDTVKEDEKEASESESVKVPEVKAPVQKEEVLPSEPPAEDGAPKSLLDFQPQSSENVVPENQVDEDKKEALSADVANIPAEKVIINNETINEDAEAQPLTDEKQQLIEFEEVVEETLDFEAEALKN